MRIKYVNNSKGLTVPGTKDTLKSVHYYNV